MDIKEKPPLFDHKKQINKSRYTVKSTLSRKQLADSKFGIKYKDRLGQSRIEPKCGKMAIKEHGNGYATLIKTVRDGD